MKLISIIATIFLLSLSSFALEVGAAAPDLKLKDQFEKPIKIPADAKYLLFVTDKKPSKLLSDSIIAADTDLQAKKVVYASDISGMPSMISSMFAIPAMKKYKFKMALDMTGEETKSWPRQADKVTVMKLENQKITEIQYLESKEDIEKFVKSL